MASLRDLRSRKRTVASIQKITNAMKVVSVSKLRRTQKQVLNLRPYAQMSREIFGHLSSGESGEGNPYLTKRPVNKVTYVLVVGDKGLCGGYNNNLMKFFGDILAEDEHDKTLVTVGKWGAETIERLGIPILRKYESVGDQADVKVSRQIADYLTEMYKLEETDKVVLVYEKFDNVMVQTPTALTLFPVEIAGAGESGEDTGSLKSSYIYEPEKKTVLSSAIQNYVHSTVYQCLLEAKAGEHAARMTAMTAATDNTKKLLDELELTMNRVRQADITTEISEIVGGASALSKRQQLIEQEKSMEDSE